MPMLTRSRDQGAASDSPTSTKLFVKVSIAWSAVIFRKKKKMIPNSIYVLCLNIRTQDRDLMQNKMGEDSGAHVWCPQSNDPQHCNTQGLISPTLRKDRA